MAEDESDKGVGYADSNEAQTCPFCGGTFLPTRDVPGGPPTGLAHTEPMCATFERLDPLAFVEAVNATIRAQVLDPQAKRRGDA